MVYRATQSLLKHSAAAKRGTRKRVYYVIAPDELINDMRISANAKVLLLHMLNQSRNWQFYIDQLARHFGKTRKCVSAWMGELIKYHYVERDRVHDAETMKSHYYYTVYPVPMERYWTLVRLWERARDRLAEQKAQRKREREQNAEKIIHFKENPQQ